ncbi:MAG: DUF2797 domain-containing protein [Pseudomonadales bacterium]
MSTLSGPLQKLRWTFAAADGAVQKPEPALLIGAEALPLAPLIGSQLRLHFGGSISCSHCGRKGKRSFGQGYCYPCFKKLARCDLCMMSPTRCHFESGTCREPDWAQDFCFAPHSVYLANSSGLKVGITGADREPTRWVDQGAVAALVLLHCDTRQLSGAMEAQLAEHISDRTQWRKMVSGDAEPIDLLAARAQALGQLGELPDGVRVADSVPLEIQYPIREYGPSKTFAMDKVPLFESTLLGIKGQYLLFADGVFNVRRHSGFDIEIHWASPPRPEPSAQLEIF